MYYWALLLIPLLLFCWYRLKHSTKRSKSAQNAISFPTSDSEVEQKSGEKYPPDVSPVTVKTEPPGKLSKFPAEIISIIIDHLHDDRHALKQCALVSQLWLQPARSHLFFSIRIQGMLLGGFSALLSLRQDANVCRFIQELHLLGWRESTRHAVWTDKPPIPLSHDEISTLLTNLPLLRVLTLTGLTYTGDSKRQSSQMTQIVSLSMRILNLESSDLDIHAFPSLLLFFPNLTTLSMLKTRWQEPHQEIPQLSPTLLPSLRLQTLALTYPDEFTIALIRNSSSVKTLTFVECTYVPDVMTSGLNALLSQASSNLLHAGFGLSDAWSPSFVNPDPVSKWRGSALRSCTCLRSLRLGVVMNPDRLHDHYTVATEILSRLSNTVAEITLTLDYADDANMARQLTSIDWRRIQNVVGALPQRPILRVLRMDRYDDYKLKRMGTEEEEIIRRSLPMLHRSNLLRFE